ncbi:non-ribosomal peptide synthetase, partial [Teredinibacter waterburyi]|uniref:non-ribosomal peptide synthetase n=1 Tax=Teredinibacter waterburyi TaxID=1500538 RepID=UPI00165FE393
MKAPKSFCDIDVEGSVARRFELQVQRYPERIAIDYAGQQFSYAKLNSLANHYAHALLAVCPAAVPTRIAVFMDKGIENIAAILAVLKCGHAYVPVDPEFPDDRNAFILSDSDAGAIIGQHSHKDYIAKLTSNAVPIIDVDQLESVGIVENCDLDVSADALAYVIYTSGSTGRPKGVMQNNRNLLHGCMRRTNLQCVTPDDRMSLFYSCSVMGSVYCIFGALLNGAGLYPYNIREDGLDELADWLVSNNISIYHSVASVFRQFSASYSQSSQKFSVRLVIFGGEKVLTSDVDAAKKVFSSKVSFYTGLGSTETGTIRYFPITAETEITSDVVPIGYPIEGVEILLLDENGAVVETGDIGEIAVKSRYIALGYWNNPEATNSVFSVDENDSAVRIYRMGDLAVENSDGLLVHRGRKDFQVKIRGFRVETGEVESALQQHPSIDEVVVTAVDVGAGTQLAAYIVLTKALCHKGVSVRSLREFLNGILPYYMIPTMFVELDELPKTPNRKVDRKALPQPSAANELVSEAPIAPSTATEKLVVEICSVLLQRDDIGINQNFFEIGGDSLTATQLVSRLNNQLNKTIFMRDIFSATDFKSLAAVLDETTESIQTPEQGKLQKAKRGDRIPLSFAQKRMWLVDQLHDASSTYNISNTIKVNGVVDIAALTLAVNKIVERHETLRTIFPSDVNGPWQQIQKFKSFNLPLLDLTSNDKSGREWEAMRAVQDMVQSPHNLAIGPLFDAKLIKLDTSEFILCFVFNHIIYDNIWSSGVFFNELNGWYRHYLNNQPEEFLPEPEFQFVDYAVWEQCRVDAAAQQHISYWQSQLANPPGPSLLPTDFHRPSRASLRGAQVQLTLPESVRLGLSHLSKLESATHFMVLIAAWQCLLYRYSGQQDILVGTPTGRRYRTETEGMIGLFINNLVVRSQCNPALTFREYLAQVRATTIEAFSHDELPFEKIVSEINPDRIQGVSPFFQHFFIHRNATKSAWKLGDLAVTPLAMHQGGSKFDITLSVLEDDDKISGTLEYATDLFERSSMERMAANYIELLSSIAANPDQLLSELSIIAPNERQQL